MSYIHPMLQRDDRASIAALAKAIDGEYTAIACYAQLANLATSDEERQQILEIRNDEIKHYHTFAHLYVSLTGKQPSPRIVEPCPSERMAGLRAAFRDEQETVDLYRDAADQSANPAVREAFRRAAADEQNHAVWFLYFLSQSGR